MCKKIIHQIFWLLSNSLLFIVWPCIEGYLFTNMEFKTSLLAIQNFSSFIIEIGHITRYTSDRKCNYCQMNVTKRDGHFIVECPLYIKLKRELNKCSYSKICKHQTSQQISYNLFIDLRRWSWIQALGTLYNWSF